MTFLEEPSVNLTPEAMVEATAIWYDDPAGFVTDVFTTDPDNPVIPQDWQMEVLGWCADDEIHRIGMCASKGPGKSCLLAWVIWWYLSTRPESQVACTSITEGNLKSGLWKELSKWYARSPMLQGMFKMTKTEITSVIPEYKLHWKCEARTWSKDADEATQSQTLAGIHGEHLLFVCDEVAGYPSVILTTADAALATGIDNKIIMAGNPTHTEGPLYEAATVRKHLWKMKHISGDPDDPKRSPMVDINWARDTIASAAQGRDDPWVRVNVLGLFPLTSLNALLGPEDIKKSLSRVVDESLSQFYQVRLGVDVARFGGDTSVFTVRQGPNILEVVVRRSMPTDALARIAMNLSNKWNVDASFVDGTGGFGGGVVDFMRIHGYTVHEIHSSSSPANDRFANRRTEMWMKMADWVRESGRIYESEQIRQELTTAQYTIQKNGKTALEPKDDIKKRLGYSPDRSDSLALTFALPEPPVGKYGISKRGTSYDTNYHPLKSIRRRSSNGMVGRSYAFARNDAGLYRQAA